MKIDRENFHEAFEYIASLLEHGYEFVAYNKDLDEIDTPNLRFFEMDYDADEYCAEISTDDQLYEFEAVYPIVRTMAASMENPELLIERDGLVDVELMVRTHFRQIYQEEQINNSNNNKKKGEVMSQNQEDQLTNLLYLQDQVAGINVKDVDNRIEAIVSGMQDKSQLEYKTIIDGTPAKATLNFSKSDKTDYQFFNNYELELFKGDTSTKQTFYINKKQNLTIGEASRLMAGHAIRKRFISKEGQPYNVWYQNAKTKNAEGQPTLRKFYDSYGFDHIALLKVSGIKDIDKGQNLYDIASRLEQGERVMVNKEVQGEIVQRQVDLSPMYKTLNFYDMAGKLKLSELMSMTKLAEMTQAPQESQQQSTAQSATAQQATGEAATVATGAAPQTEAGNQQHAEAPEKAAQQATVQQASVDQGQTANQSQAKKNALKEDAKPTTQRAARNNRRGRSVA